KPLKYGPQIESLQELITALYKEFETDYVDIEMVNHIMLSYKSDPSEWRKFAKFDRYKYTRNLVDGGNGKFNLIILCWGEGHASSIHDHSDSHCFMKMLQGQLTETKFEATEWKERFQQSNSKACELQEIGKTTIGTNDVCYINDNIGLHQVENPSHTDTSVSLHLYCPPFNSCSVFQKNLEKMTCPVTFWSKYGVR
uniref:Cysteine dioxygenase n=1 Tax=Megaselia scalaris TaxID=36166 RepID=T1H7F3_MEGSC